MEALLLEHLNNHFSGWSLGTFGALGEFTFDEGETLLIAPNDIPTIATSRGALRIDNTRGVEAVAYETSRRHRDKWGQAVAFCLPESEALMSGRKVLTEIAPDEQSVLDEHRESILFDLGLNTPFVDVCVRTSDPALISELRKFEGISVWDSESGAMKAILKHHPHRIFISKIGRLEVFQPIGIEKSPEGPHTHVLPKLLATGLHHAANAPIPEGLYSVLMLYPGNPCVDNLGHDREFDTHLHQGFQSLLRKQGLEEYVTQKQSVLEAFRAEEDLDSYPKPQTKLQRLACRIALRQAHHTDGESDQLSRWRSRFDRVEKVDESIEVHS